MISTALRNPYLDAFLKYMQPPGTTFETGIFGWEPRSDWRSGDGYDGPKWKQHAHDTTNAFMARRQLCHHMAFAVPTDEAITAIAGLEMPVLEIGAGNGYWAWLLEQAAVEVAAYDLEPDGNYWCAGEHWTRVRKGGAAALLKHPDHALMLCWPPYGSPMAADCLSAYRGEAVIYIGEGEGGCTASDAFFGALERGFAEETRVALPQWPGLHDDLSIWRRVNERS